MEILRENERGGGSTPCQSRGNKTRGSKGRIFDPTGSHERDSQGSMILLDPKGRVTEFMVDPAGSYVKNVRLNYDLMGPHDKKHA